MAQTATTFSALVLESDALTRERVRQMLTSEGFATCLVDQVELFHLLRSRFSFDLFIVGVRGSEGLDSLRLDSKIQPLLLLAPLQEPTQQARYRMALPDAVLIDRSLRDPDVLRRQLNPMPPDVPADASDPVEQAFAEFGLSRRQLQVLARALVGNTSRQIAAELFISEPTVRNHLHAIYDRVGVSGRRELLGRFVAGLIERDVAGEAPVDHA